MPPIGGKKAQGKARSDARSRNTTPISTTSNEQMSSGDSSSMSYAELLKDYGSLSSPPPVGQLKRILDSLKAFSEVAKIRSDTCDKGMRELAKRRRELSETIRQRELADRQAEEERKQKELKKSKLKKEQEEERPLAVGAHALAPQDGSAPEADAKTEAQAAVADTTMEDAPEIQPRRASATSNSSGDSHQPKPERAIPAYQTFGSDPSTFDDPTIYHIRDWTVVDDEEEKQDILGVSGYPHSDLHDLTCGTPPDRDLQNAKPQNQVTANQFATYLEPYTRPLTEEDLAFLMERGDRVSPFVIPRRGPRHYKDIWAEEDTSLYGDPAPLPTDQPSTTEPSGSLEQMTDELAETSDISLGPMMSRLLAAMRPIHRTPEANGEPLANGTGDTDADGDIKMDNASTNTITNPSEQPKSATYFPESTLPGFKTEYPKLTAAELDDRLKAQLQHIGFLDPSTSPDYAGHHDDEIAARLRYLQEELQRVSILNGARKARIRELIEYAMAQQEWMTISDDLDSQLNQAFLKRHRHIGKGKNKVKRPGQAAGVAVGTQKPSLGESTRAIMQRRADWREMIGPVVDFGESRVPEGEVFETGAMERLMEKERADWTEAHEGG